MDNKLFTDQVEPVPPRNPYVFGILAGILVAFTFHVGNPDLSAYGLFVKLSGYFYFFVKKVVVPGITGVYGSDYKTILDTVGADGSVIPVSIKSETTTIGYHMRSYYATIKYKNLFDSCTVFWLGSMCFSFIYAIISRNFEFKGIPDLIKTEFSSITSSFSSFGSFGFIKNLLKSILGFVFDPKNNRHFMAFLGGMLIVIGSCVMNNGSFAFVGLTRMGNLDIASILSFLVIFGSASAVTTTIYIRSEKLKTTVLAAKPAPATTYSTDVTVNISNVHPQPSQKSSGGTSLISSSGSGAKPKPTLSNSRVKSSSSPKASGGSDAKGVSKNGSGSS